MHSHRGCSKEKIDLVLEYVADDLEISIRDIYKKWNVVGLKSDVIYISI